MSIKPIKKQPIGLIFLLPICFSLLFGTAANGSETYHVPSGETTYGRSVRVTWADPPNRPLGDVSTSWSVSPNNGVTLDHAHRTDDNGVTWFRLTFGANACGTYTVTMWLPSHPPGWSTYQARIVYGEPCPSGTSSSSGGTTTSSSDTSSLPTPSKLVKISGDNQTGLTGGVLANPFVVEVRDQYDAPLEGTSVTFTILTGGGTFSNLAPTTNANGQASSTLRLGAEAGTNTVEVSVKGISETVTFAAEAIPPTLMSISGNNQSGAAGTALANPFVVEVRDGNGNPLAGVAVTFIVRTGSGTLTDAIATTDANGQAAITLRLGTEAGTNTVEVSIEGIPETITFTAEAIPPTLTSISGNNQSRAAGTALANPFVVEVRDGNGNPLAGVAVTFIVRTGGGALTDATATTNANGQADSTLRLGTDPGTNTVEVRAEGISDIVTFNAVAELLEFDLSLSAGFNLIHLPLKVRVINGMPAAIQSVSDLYDALGGANTVTHLITIDSQTQDWSTYSSPSDKGRPANNPLTHDMGILAKMRTPTLIRLSGTPLGTDRSSTVTLNPGYNIVGVPLRDSRLTHVSDLFTLEGIGGNAPMIIFTDNGKLKGVTSAGGPDDIPIIGGQAFILKAQEAATVDISGDGWTNVSGTAAAPLMLTGIQVADTTPVLALSGSIVDGGTGLKVEGFRVTVKNLSIGKAVAAITPSDETGYRSTVIDIETGRAATVGDILEISAESPHPFIGVKPLQYTVTAEDVKRSLIQLPTLVAYEIPAETALLPNYPNPFNPETWIPYQLAEDAFVTLTIYDGNGRVVRTLDVGHRSAAVYQRRSQAIYWDGKNELGEQVASGIYFYHLFAARSGLSVSHQSDYSATRKMMILK